MKLSSVQSSSGLSSPAPILPSSPAPLLPSSPSSSPTVSELQAEVARLKALLKEKDRPALPRGSIVDVYSRVKQFALLESPSSMAPPHMSAVWESPEVEAFHEFILRPIAVSESLVARLGRGLGFSTAENGGQPVVVGGNKTVGDTEIETSVRNCLELKRFIEVLRRGALQQHCDAAVTEHSLEVLLHSALCARPWLHVASLDPVMRYTSKAPTQGKVHELCLFFWDDEAAAVRRYQTTPGAALFWRIGQVALLAVPCESNGFNADSDYKRARTLALLSFYAIAGVLGSTERVVVPFVTLNGAHVQLHVIAMVPGEPRPSVFSHPVWSWSLEQPGLAIACLSCMFRLAEWVSAFGSSHLLPGRVAALASVNLKRLELGYMQTKPVPKEALDVLLEHYGVVEFTVGQRHFLTSSGSWVKIYLSHADGAAEARILTELRNNGITSAGPRLLQQWLLPHDAMAVEMEYCGTSLRKIENWQELARRVRELALILNQIHSKNWIHGDLKEGNVCVDSADNLRVIDWEGAVSAGQRPVFWTDTYRAPETLALIYTAKSDMYSVGVMLERWLGRMDSSDEDELAFWNEVKAGLLLEDAEERWDAEKLLAKLAKK